MIELVLTICALTMVAPYYDCSEEWVIFYYPENIFVPIKSPYGIYASGWAVWNTTKYSVCDWREGFDSKYCDSKWIAIDKTEGDECYDYKCYPVFYHEAKHLFCECNWHTNMTGTRNEGVFR